MRVAATAAVLFWPSSQGLSGLKGIFPFPYPGTASSQTTAKHGSALVWTLIIQLGLSFPPGTAKLCPRVLPPCPQAFPSLSSWDCSRYQNAALRGWDSSSSDHQHLRNWGTRFQSAVNAWTPQHNCKHSQGTEGSASFAGPKFISLFKARSEPPRFWLLQIPLLWSYEKTFVVGWFPFALDSCQEQQNGPRQNVMWV